MKKRALKTKTSSKLKEPLRDRDLPVTKRLLDLTKQELKGDISTVRLELASLRSETKAGFAQIDAKFQNQDAKFESLETKITKMMILMEDQNDRNRATIDSNAILYQKIIDNDSRVDSLEERVFGIKQR